MPQTYRRRSRHARDRSRSWVLLLAGSLLGIATGLVPLASPGADYASLAQVESAVETRDYSQQVRDKKFAAEQEAFLRNVLLPQLSLDANRPAIARTRQRIRELALRDAAKEVVEPVNSLLRDEMLKLAADGSADPIVRVNAMLLVGELTGGDGKPWPGAAASLTNATGNQELPLAVRVAALAGLSGHVTAAAAGAPEIAPLAGPAVAGIVTNPPDGDPVASRWLLGRALDLLPSVAAPPAAVTAAATILADENADPDVRVRAARALGKVAKPEAGIDATAAVAQIRELAVAALAADLAAAEQRRFAKKLGSRDPSGGGFAGGRGEGFMPPMGPAFGGGGVFGGQFGGEFGGGEADPATADEDAVPTLACRRDAWRLYVCAEAISPARSGPGLAELLAGDAQAAAGDLAATLRQAALDLDAQPDEKTLEQALDSLRQAAGPAGPAADRPAKPPTGREPPPAASPFDQPAEKSPF